MLFSLNLTFVIFIASFLLFMVLLNEWFLKPVGRAIEQRNALIEGDIRAGKQAHEEAQKLFAQYEDDLKRIRHEAQAVIHQATEDANRERAAHLDRIAKEGHAKLEKAKAEIEAERASLIDALVAEERELVETITRKVLGDESVQVQIDTTQVRRTLEEAC